MEDRDMRATGCWVLWRIPSGGQAVRLGVFATSAAAWDALAGRPKEIACRIYAIFPEYAAS